MSEINYTFINGERICYQHIIGLTATPPIGELRGKLDRIAPIVDRITIPEAIGNKWISNYIEFNYGLDFTVQEQELYVQLSKPITETLDSFRDVHKLLNLPNVESPLALMNCCTNGYMYKEFNKTNNMWDTHRIDSMHMCNAVATTMGWNVNIDVSTERGRKLNHDWSPTAIKERCLNFRTVSRRRNDLINNNKVKLNAILEILTKFNNKRGIIFNQSTEFADKLTASINFKEPNSAICYHSNIESRFLYNTDGSVITTKAGIPKKFGKTTLKKLALEGMLTNKFKYLVTVMALDAGLDITNLNLAIITSGTINPLQDKQRKGRSFRINPFAEDEVVIIFNLYMKNFKHLDTDITSRDYVKLTKRQTDSELPCIFIDSLDEIQYLYKI
jgi:superfamily II DNA or RNA helicase